MSYLSDPMIMRLTFLLSLLLSLGLWILRGQRVGLVTVLPGGVLWILILLTLGSGFICAIQLTKR